MSNFKINDGVVVDYTNDGWDEFKKWLDGTYAYLVYTWIDEGLAYNIIAIDGPFYRTFSINKTDAEDFEENYKLTTPIEQRTVGGTPLFKLESPEESDGKPVIVVSPFTEGLYMFISTRGDLLTDGVIGRGEGTKLYLTWTGDGYEDEEKSVWATFQETVEMHDGHVDFDPDRWGFDDEWSVAIRIPATPVTADEYGQGNCNIIEIIPESGMHVIIPAAGDGYYNVDLATAIAIPDEGNGFWDYDPWTDEFTPTAGGADWQLFDFSPPIIYLIKNMMCSSRRGFWELDAYKVESIYARWQFGLICKRVNAANRGAAEIGGHYTCFREDTT